MTPGREHRIALSAGDDNQKVNDNYQGSGHGLFTYFLLKALRGAADGNTDGVITHNELIAYVESRVFAASDGKQTPQKGQSVNDGWFLFQVPNPAE